MALLAGPDVLLRNLLSTVGVLHGSAHTPSPQQSFIESIHHGHFGELWWLEIHVMICNRDGIRLSGYGGNTNATGLRVVIYDPEGNRVPNVNSYRSRSASSISASEFGEGRMTRMKSRSDSFGESRSRSPGLTQRNTQRKYAAVASGGAGGEAGTGAGAGGGNPQSARQSQSPRELDAMVTRSDTIDSEITRSRPLLSGSLVMEDPEGGYRYIFYSHHSCLVSFHLLIGNGNDIDKEQDGGHLCGSPTPYFWCNLGPSTPLFNEHKGNILYASSVLTINGWPDANSPEHLRVMNTNAGWLTDGTGTETVVVGFHAIVSLEKIHLLNWAARRFPHFLYLSLLPLILLALGLSLVVTVTSPLLFCPFLPSFPISWLLCFLLSSPLR
jgi:hypothetical protein